MRLGSFQFTKLLPILEEKLYGAIPACHSLTGCDSTSSLAGIGKRSAWKVFRNGKRHQETLGRIGQTIDIDAITADETEAFICSLYPSPKKVFLKAGDLRYAMFCRQKHKNESLPPTSDSVYLHIERFNCEIYVWRKSLQSIQDSLLPVGHGQIMSNEVQLIPVRMTKGPAPASLVEIHKPFCKKH